MLILPGNTSSGKCHRGELEYFSQCHTTASIDFLGTGSSDRLLDWPSDWWLQASQQAVALIDHLGFASGAVMGTSGGAFLSAIREGIP